MKWRYSKPAPAAQRRAASLSLSSLSLLAPSNRFSFIGSSLSSLPTKLTAEEREMKQSQMSKEHLLTAKKNDWNLELREDHQTPSCHFEPLRTNHHQQELSHGLKILMHGIIVLNRLAALLNCSAHWKYLITFITFKEWQQTSKYSEKEEKSVSI